LLEPRVLTEALAAGGDEAKRAFDAMMGMKKIDVAAIMAARRADVATLTHQAFAQAAKQPPPRRRAA
jgi:hypothetical protein